MLFRLLTDFVCLYTYEFCLSLCKIVRSSVILLLPFFSKNDTLNRKYVMKSIKQTQTIFYTAESYFDSRIVSQFFLYILIFQEKTLGHILLLPFFSKNDTLNRKYVMKSIKQTQTLQRENCDQIVLDIIDNT
jgi:hypothetical protein